jgi:hypothetical protein
MGDVMNEDEHTASDSIIGTSPSLSVLRRQRYRIGCARRRISLLIEEMAEMKRILDIPIDYAGGW